MHWNKEQCEEVKWGIYAGFKSRFNLKFGTASLASLVPSLETFHSIVKRKHSFRKTLFYNSYNFLDKYALFFTG